MKAAVWHARRDIRIEDVQEPPDPAKGQVKVRVAWCGICGSDLHEYVAGPVKIPVGTPHPMTGVKAPVIMGHELSGRIVDVGPGVSRWKVDDRVALQTLIGCQKCKWCTSGLMGLCPHLAFLGKSWHGGGFSAYVNVYDYMCYRLPEQVSDEVGALVEPFAAAVRAVRQGRVQPKERVALIGAGPIGLMTLQAVRITGAESVTIFEPADIRREFAWICGASQVFDPVTQDPLQAALEMTDGEGFDVVFECVGSAETGMLAGRMARRRGRVIIVGVFEAPAPLDYTDLVFGEKTLIGTMGGYGVFDDAIEMMASGQFLGKPLVTGKIPIEQIVPRGFEALLHQKEEHINILVQPE
jgi:(R,R)-butanediol dehydrogenase/meso-butanediol dehydrogenase/diacetyl reductase